MTMKPGEKLDLILKIVLWGLAAAVVYVLGSVLFHGNVYPHNTFLFTGADRFMDFFNTRHALKAGFAPYSNPDYLMPHFPFAMFLEYMFTFLPRDLSFTLFMAGFTAYYLWGARYLLSGDLQGTDLKFRLPAMLLLCYPLLFLLDRANFETFVYIFLSLFIYLYYQARSRTLASLSLAAAIAMKLFPAIFLLIFLAERDFRSLAKTAFFSVLLTVGALAVATGGIAENWAMFSQAQSKYFTLYILGTPDKCCGLAFGHSFFGVLRLAVASFAPENYGQLMRLSVTPYNALVLLYAGAVAVYVVFLEKTLWRRTAMLVFAFNLLPYVSADYKLIHLLIPVLLFIKAEDKVRAKTYCVLFGLMLIPKAFYRFGGILSDSGAADVSLSVVLTPLLMLGASVLLAADAIKARRPDTKGGA